MKKLFFFFSMLLASVATNAQVTRVEPVSANYATKTVSFRVWWNAGTRDATHLSKVWVWVDYIRVNANNTTSGNAWTRAAVSTASASPTSTITYDGTNRQGFWLQGNSGSYSATVTVQLNITETKFNWCAYVSDYPPNVTASNGTYTFKGTPPFTLIASDGTTTQTVTGKTLTASALTMTPTTIRDKTECPGVFCIYSGSDLYIDATRLCQQRTSGAQNWEAWIKDTRDNELYRIVLMPDNKWWLAQNLKYAGAGYPAVGCTPDECGRAYPHTDIVGGSSTGGNIQGICPANWLLPVNDNWNTLMISMGGNNTAVKAIRMPTSPCGGATNYYGFADTKSVCFSPEGVGTTSVYLSQWFSRLGTVMYAFVIDGNNYCNDCDGKFSLHNYQSVNRYQRVRCFRQL
jgi:uncharacterized protein (TIGR02145 family)